MDDLKKLLVFPAFFTMGYAFIWSMNNIIIPLCKYFGI